uniref:Uncharacterized protein LOC111127726 isoform X1 n=1 Tax=Crassostrea virginica TaxID=6565 RepID=A0A8B8DLN3_CRAVI|nr:uncharacterized protein LOC111127726 isoform X1 [Crassostrea virginica]XP_022331633.1 uncharacterized protein LOC111129505 isoform X1 [Crassostrea virginica]
MIRKKLLSFLKDKAPYLFDILKCVVKEEHFISTAASVLMYGHSQRLSQLQYIVGLSLDRCGLTKEGLQLMHDLGLCVSPRSVLRKKKELVAEQEEKIKSTVTAFVKNCEKSASKDDTVSSQTIQVNSQEKATAATTLLQDLDHSRTGIDASEEFVVGKDNSDNLMEQDPSNIDLSSDISINERNTPAIEMLGDNIDVSITPSKMTAESQRKSLHWFLIMMKQKRIMVNDMDISELRQEKDVLSLPKVSWIPDKCQQKSMTENVKHHICHILVKYVDFLKPFESVIPPYVTHKFIELTKAKSLFLNCELIEASENSASGMISIMQRIHELSVPHARLTDKKVYERVVFGGDVLTNERAFSAQQNMQLNRSDVDRLVGLIHRPEGLHREMNFLLMYFCVYEDVSSPVLPSFYLATRKQLSWNLPVVLY